MNLDKKNINADNTALEKLKALQQEVEEMKRKAVLEKYEIKQLPNNGRYYVTLPDGKRVKKTKKSDLENYIIGYELSKNDTLVSLFPSYLADRKMSVKPTTWEKEIFYFETFLKKSALGNMPIVDIRIKDGHEFFQYCKKIKPDIRKRYWNNIHHSFLNQMFSYAVQSDIIICNPLKEMKIKDFQFTPPLEKSETDKVYMPAEKEGIIRLIWEEYKITENPICLGILILFQTTIRVGELCGLQWGDVEGSILKIRRQYTKGTLCALKTHASKRDLYLSDDLVKLLSEIKKANIRLGYPTDTKNFIFLRNIQNQIIPCTDRCFNGRLDKYCDMLDITHKSCHDIRRTAITELYENCHDIKIVQSIAGHSSQTMTEQYVKYRDKDKEKDVLNTIAIHFKAMEQNGTFDSHKEKTANPLK